MSFDEYLSSKKIDKIAFEAGEPLRFAEWRLCFEQMHPDGFTAQKKFLINPTRRKFLLKTGHSNPTEGLKSSVGLD